MSPPVPEVTVYACRCGRRSLTSIPALHHDPHFGPAFAACPGTPVASRYVLAEGEQPSERDLLAAASIMVGTLLSHLPADRRQWLEDLVERQDLTFRGADRIQQASRAILREVDTPMGPDFQAAASSEMPLNPPPIPTSIDRRWTIALWADGSAFVDGPVTSPPRGTVEAGDAWLKASRVEVVPAEVTAEQVERARRALLECEGFTFQACGPDDYRDSVIAVIEALGLALSTSGAGGEPS